MFKVGTGWLGWTPDQVLDANMEHVRMAHEGRLAMLTAIFGDGKKTDKDAPHKLVSMKDPEGLDAFFAKINANRRNTVGSPPATPSTSPP